MSKNLVDKLLEASSKIHKSSTKGSGNYITVNESSKSEYRKYKIKKLFNE